METGPGGSQRKGAAAWIGYDALLFPKLYFLFPTSYFLFPVSYF
jgi:hypothetical protein